MTYFQNTPLIRYELEDYLSAVKDITLRVQFKEKILVNSVFWDEYIIKDNDTPEKISYALYGTTFYHWIILLANDIIDPYTDWPIPNSVFDEWVEEKYKQLDCNTKNGGKNAVIEVSGINEVTGAITELNIVSGGVDYSNPVATVTPWTDSKGQSAYINLTAENGVITAATIINAGFDYENGKVSITIEDDLSQYNIKGADRTKYYMNLETGIPCYVKEVEWGTCRLPADINDSNQLTPDIPDGIYPVSYRYFEILINDQKRHIKVPKSDLIPFIISEFDTLLAKTI